MRTKLHYVLSTTIFLIAFSAFGQKNLFIEVSKSINPESRITKRSNDKGLLFDFDYTKLHKVLSRKSTKTNSTKTSGIIISFPNTNGEFERYRIEEASVMSPNLQEKYPEIKSYIGYGIDSPHTYLRFSLSPYKGLSGIILGNKETTLFEPNSKNKNQITVLKKSNLDKNETFNCLTENNSLEKTFKSSLNIKDADDSIKRTYKIAISVTGEYAAYHGGTLALVNAAITKTLTNINAVFENDFNVSLQLVSTNDAVIYLDAGIDPYGDTSNNYNNELQATLDTEILEANYDIGHLLSAVGSVDGNAGCIGCVCVNGLKGSGYTSDNTPDGFIFDIDLVAHEIGHQFGANHTWTHNGNEGENVQMEPGSGSTIMGYAGITGSTNVQANSDPYFHAISIEQITTYFKSTSCASTTNTGNTTPTVNAGSNLTLPIGTPFKLVGNGVDIDGDILTYCWEQIDENNAATTYPDASSTDSNSVLFRSYLPTINNIRYFPNLSDLKFGINATQWEKIPIVNRTANFRLTVRDNKAGGANNNHDDIAVAFNDAYGPLEVTSQNTSGILWTRETNETITWNVNNTNSLPGASNVNILLSLDGGATYNSIVNDIPNNGSYTLTVPKTPAPHCRIMIEPTNNNFFAINTEDFAIDYDVSTTCTQYSSALSLGIDITDNGDSFTQSHIINIPNDSTISDINIGVNITHPYIGDLDIGILSPNSTEILLKSSKDCDEEDNIIGVFNDDAITYNCSNSGANIASKSLRDLLNSFNGENSSGDWTILLGDFESGDLGTLNSWFVEICETTETTLINENEEEFEFVDFPEFLLFPNPSRGQFKIQLSSDSDRITIELFDIRGRLIHEKTYNTIDGNFDEDINLNNIQSGIYILNIHNGIQKSTKKIIIE